MGEQNGGGVKRLDHDIVAVNNELVLFGGMDLTRIFGDWQSVSVNDLPLPCSLPTKASFESVHAISQHDSAPAKLV